MNQNTNNHRGVRAVFFDLFETLITEQTRPDFRSRPPSHHLLKCSSETLSHWWQEKGTHQWRERLIGAKYRDCEAALQACCADVCSPLTNDEITSIAAEHKQWKAIVLSRVDPSIIDLVQSLRGMGFSVGVISNVLPEERLAWDSCPLRDIIDDAVFSCDVGMMKPQIEIYQLACDRLSIHPSNACFIGDGSFEELQGAISAGMIPIHAVWYQNQKIDWPPEYGTLQRALSMTDVLELFKDSRVGCVEQRKSCNNNSNQRVHSNAPKSGA